MGVQVELLRYSNGDGWADVIDALTMCPHERKAVRLLAASLPLRFVKARWTG
jgi:hypothetical protein